MYIARTLGPRVKKVSRYLASSLIVFIIFKFWLNSRLQKFRAIGVLKTPTLKFLEDKPDARHSEYGVAKHSLNTVLIVSPGVSEYS
jgi:hypothetical protein